MFSATGFMTIFGNAWATATPCDVARSQILMLYNQEVWKPRRTFLAIACCRNCCPNTSPKFHCVTEVSLQAEIPNYIYSGLLHLSPQRTSPATCVITYQQATISQLFFPSRVVIGFVNIKSKVSSTSLIPVSLSIQSLGQHRHTWLRPSHSGFNSISIQIPLT